MALTQADNDAPDGVNMDAARQHWAFQPVQPVEPAAHNKADAGRNPIDLFIEASLRQHGLTPLDAADKRTLIRRATFDLTGLPPTPKEVEAFVNDGAPDAYQRLIDRLLASPHYGERWGRHWLDVVRYADTAGETADFPLPQAWRYRNYVIDAFNRDKPYDRFIREQLAGDLLAKQLPADAPVERYAELVIATGYVAIARRFGFDIEKDHFLTIDDTLDTLGKSVLGLTIGCARCHDHMYDPISVQDYYALYGIFESTRYPFSGCEKTKRSHNLVAMVPPNVWQRQIEPYNKQRASLDQRLKAANAQSERLAKGLGELADKGKRLLAEGTIDQSGRQTIASGAKSKWDEITVKKGQLILLSVDPRGNYGADSTRVELILTEVAGEQRTWNVARDVSNDFLAGNPHADGLGNDHTWSYFDLRGGMRLLSEPVRDHFGKPGFHFWRRGDWPSAWVNATNKPIQAWSTMPPRTFYLHPSVDGAVGLAWKSPINGRVKIVGLVADGHPGQGNGVVWRLEHLQNDFTKSLATSAQAAQQERDRRQALAAHDARKPTVQYAYAVAEGQPHDAQVQLRGDPNVRGLAVPRRDLLILGGRQITDKTASGRLELAHWLTSPDHPLTARVMVNRIWQHHFGVGLVSTPNNFGLRGQPPTHPRLLDYLARYFIDHGWSVKAMHRLIMSSRAYRRSSVTEASTNANAARDPDNVWLWRFNLRRLSAEEIRDAVLVVSGRLDRVPGKSHPFPPQDKWGFTQHNPFNAVYDHNKRSVYLMTQRLKRHPFLGLFDGADTAASTAGRHTTTVPTQALFFMNNPFVHENANHLAATLMRESDTRSRIDRAFQLLYGRPATEADHTAARQFLAGGEADLASWLRVMMAGNEFLYVD